MFHPCRSCSACYIKVSVIDAFIVLGFSILQRKRQKFDRRLMPWCTRSIWQKVPEHEAINERGTKKNVYTQVRSSGNLHTCAVIVDAGVKTSDSDLM